MTAFEKSLRAMDGAALRAGAEELLSLLTKAGGVRRGRGGSGEDGARKRSGAAARDYAPDAADVSPAEGGGGTETVSAVSAPASDGAVPETARVRRDYPQADGGGPAAEEAAGEDGGALPETEASDIADGEDRRTRKDRKNRKDRKAQKAREEREKRGEQGPGDDPDGPEAREDQDGLETPESRENLEVRENRDAQTRTLRAEDGETARTQDTETIGRAEVQALEKRLESVSAQRRGRAGQDGEDTGSGTYTAAFRGPERQYEGAVGARGMEMRRISEYFRRDSRRYDTGFTRY